MSYERVETAPVAPRTRGPARVAPPAAEPGVDLKGIVSILKRRRGTVLAVAAAILLAVIAYLSVATPVYTAAAQLLVEPRWQRAGDDGSGPDPLPAEGVSALVESQLKIIGSRNVLKRVVADERLDADPEFTEPGGVSVLVRRVAALFGLPAKAPGEGAPEGPAERALRQLDRSVSTRRAEKSLVIEVRASAAQAAKAARLANAVVEAYLAEETAARIAVANRVAASLEAQLPAMRDEVRRAELAVQRHRFQYNITGAPESPSLTKSEALVELRDLERKLAAARDIYDSHLLRTRKAAEYANTDRIGARVISLAGAPSAPSWPLRGVLLGLGIFAGLGLGVAAALTRDHFDDRLHTGRQVEDGTGYPVLSVVPPLALDGAGFAKGRERDFTRLYDALRESPPDQPATVPSSRKIVLVTSAGPGEGKSTLAWNLAATAAREGERVLVILADTGPSEWAGRSPPDDPGPESSDDAYDEQVARVLVPGDVAGASFFVRRFWREAGTEAMKDMFLALKRQLPAFNFVVVDCGASADDRLLRAMSTIVHDIVLVAGAGRTRASDLHDVATTLRPAAERIAGVVLNRARER